MIGLADGIALHNPGLLIVDSLIILEFILRFSSLKYMTEILTPHISQLAALDPQVEASWLFQSQSLNLKVAVLF